MCTFNNWLNHHHIQHLCHHPEHRHPQPEPRSPPILSSTPWASTSSCCTPSAQPSYPSLPSTPSNLSSATRRHGHGRYHPCAFRLCRLLHTVHYRCQNIFVKSILWKSAAYVSKIATTLATSSAYMAMLESTTTVGMPVLIIMNVR
jgi:hypothetical protein